MNLHTNTRLHNHSMNSTDPRTIMNGNLPAQLDPRNSGLNALWFCEDDITAFLPSWKYPQYAELLSITKVIKLLGHGISTPKEQFPRELFNVSMSKRIFRITESQAQQLLEQYNECTFSPTRTRKGSGFVINQRISHAAYFYSIIRTSPEAPGSIYVWFGTLVRRDYGVYWLQSRAFVDVVLQV